MGEMRKWRLAALALAAVLGLGGCAGGAASDDAATAQTEEAADGAAGGGNANGDANDENADGTANESDAGGAAENGDAGDKAADFEIRDLIGTPTDYSVADNWMYCDTEPDEDVDLFYIYPTVYDDEDGTDLSAVDDKEVRLIAQLVYGKTGSAFGDYTNVYAPYYRQTNLAVAKGMTGEEYEEYNMQEQRTDIYAALDYFFEHYNNGRPFILAGHSQGACLLKITLGEYMQAHPDYLERMVACYAVGFSVTDDWLEEHPYVKFAEGADDTGVIISWNTEGSDNEGPSLVVEGNAVSINPINWKRDETTADASESLGSRTIDEAAVAAGIKDGSITSAEQVNDMWEVVPGVADATVDLERGTVICTTQDDYNENTEIFGTESFHSHDYDFYYEDIKANGQTRIAAYFAEHPAE